MKRNAALRLALSVILVFSVLLGFAVGASELAEYEIILNVPQTAAALEFFVVIPAAAEYVGFEPDMRPENPQSVHFAEKAESGGVWICVYADFNAYKGNSVVPGKVLVRMANPEQSLNITNVSAYSVIDFYTPNGAVVGAASATFVESRRVNTPP
ncbi:MAG: hypothetical protein LBN43_01150, partial [Oscillospiraceae bacterium]|nr:hypothetical protein [Oscillospiraceae bacterium]